MSVEDEETIDSTNDTTEEVEKTEEVEEVAATEDSETEEKPQYTPFETKMFERAKEAEAENKRLKEELAQKSRVPKPQPKASEKQDTLSPMDVLLLSKSNITEKEDVEELVSFANFRKISVSDALKDSTMQAILRSREEVRKTAQATNTGGARRGTSKPSDDQILANAAEGKYPDDAEALAEARMNAKLNKNKK